MNGVRVGLLLSCLLIYIRVNSQTITSTSSGGRWADQASWIGGIVPDASNSTHIVVNGNLTIDDYYNAAAPLIIDQFEINASVLVSAEAAVMIRNGVGTDITIGTSGALMVHGRLTAANGVTFNGNSPLNFIYYAGSTYEHSYTSATSSLPAASYDAQSTIILSAFTTGNFNTSWDTPVGNVIYTCTAQGNGNVNFAGMLRRVAGNLEIRNSGNGIVYANATGSSHDISIGGSLEISGSSRFFVTASGDVEVKVSGDFNFHPDISLASQCSVTGTGSLIIEGNADFNQGTWSFSSGAGGTGVMTVLGNVDTRGALITSTGSGSSSASLILSGNADQYIASNGIHVPELNLIIENSNGVVIDGNLIIGGSCTHNKGVLTLMNGLLIINGAFIQDLGIIDTRENASISFEGQGSFPDNLRLAEGAKFSRFRFDRAGTTVQLSASVNIDTLEIFAGIISNTGTISISADGVVERRASSASSQGSIVYPLSIVDSYNLVYNTTIPLTPGPEFSTTPGVIEDFTKRGTGTLILTNDLIVTTDLTVTEGAIDDGGMSFIVSVGGDVTCVGKIQATNSRLALTANATTAEIIGGGSIKVASIDFNRSVVVGCDIQISGEFGMSLGGYLNCVSGTFAFAGSVILPANDISFYHLTILPSSSLTAPSRSFTVKGDFTISNTSSSFVHNGGTVVFAGTTALLGTGIKSFNNIGVETGAQLNTLSNMQIQGDVVNDGVINLGAGTLTLSGGDQHLAGSSTVTTLANVNVSGSTTTDVQLTIAGSLIVNGQMTLNRGATVMGAITLGNNASIFTSGDKITVAGTITVPSSANWSGGAGSEVEVSGNLSVSGTMNLSAPIVFSGETVLTGTGIKQFHDVTIAGSFTPNAIYYIAGSLNVLDGATLNPGANTTIFNGTACRTSGTANFNNLILDEGSTLTSDSFLVTNATFTVSGSFVCNGGLRCNGDMLVSVDTGAVIINYKPFYIQGTLTVSSGAALTTNEGADAHFAGNLSSSGDVQFGAPAYFEGTSTMTGSGSKVFSDIYVAESFKPNATLTVTGNFIVGDTGILLEGSSTTTFSGDSSIFNNAGSAEAYFHNILVTADHQLTNKSPLRCNGTFRTSGDMIAEDDIIIVGNTTISRGGKLSTAGASHIELRANFAISGSYNATCPTFFAGKCKLTGAGLKNFTDVIIKDSLTSYTGILNINGNITNDGVFVHNGGTVVFGGNTEKKVFTTLTSAPAMVFNNITVNGGSADTDVTFDMNTSLAGALTLNTATALAKVDVDGISNDKTFTVLSLNDDPAQDGKIAALTSDAIVTGKISVQRFLSGEGRIYRYLSSPMQGPDATVAAWQQSFPITGTFTDPSPSQLICGRVVNPLNPSLFYFEEASRSYVPFPTQGLARDNALSPGRGYAAFIRQCDSPTTVTVLGNLIDGVNRGRVSLPVFQSDSNSTYNNLLGNPLPSAIDWDLVTLTNVSPTIAIRDNGTGVFKYYTRGGAGANDIPSGVIATGQAFWARSTGTEPAVIVSENCKSTSNGIFFRTGEQDVLEIKLFDPVNEIDETTVAVIPGSSGNGRLDFIDAPKINNQRDDPAEELEDIFTLNENGIALAVNAVPEIACDVPMKIGLKNLRKGDYTIVFASNGLFNSVRLIVTDNLSGQSYNGYSSISFTVTDDPRSSSSERFSIVFNSIPIRTDIPITSDQSICDEEPLKISFTSLQPGILYFGEINHRINSDTLSGDTLIIPARLFDKQHNVISLKAKGGCGVLPLDSIVITHLISPVITPTVEQVCNTGAAKLSVADASSDWIITWYDSSRIAIGTGASCTTTEISNTTKYFVTASDTSVHCPARYVGVEAVVVKIKRPVITETDGYLVSNFDHGNRWFLNNEMLKDTSRLIKLTKTGSYRLEVDSAGCHSTTEKLVVVTGTEESRDIHAYPNPMQDFLIIQLPPSVDGIKGSLSDINGRVRTDFKASPSPEPITFSIPIKDLEPGVYFVRVLKGDEVKWIRVVKE